MEVGPAVWQWWTFPASAGISTLQFPDKHLLAVEAGCPLGVSAVATALVTAAQCITRKQIPQRGPSSNNNSHFTLQELLFTSEINEILKCQAQLTGIPSTCVGHSPGHGFCHTRMPEVLQNHQGIRGYYRGLFRSYNHYCSSQESLASCGTLRSTCTFDAGESPTLLPEQLVPVDTFHGKPEPQMEVLMSISGGVLTIYPAIQNPPHPI